MQNSFEQINEVLDNLLIICNETLSISKIEQDILLDKLRKLYLQTIQIKTQEPASPSIPDTVEKLEQPQPEYAVHQGIVDDVDLFFDTDHESYGAPTLSDPIQKEEAPVVEPMVAQNVKPEPVAAPMRQPVVEEKPKPVVEKIQASEDSKVKPSVTPTPNMTSKSVADATTPQSMSAFSQPKVETRPIQETKPEVKMAAPVSEKPDKEIEPIPLQSEEDDLLQFIPQKSEQKQQPSTTQTRSLNDLFIEQREDRSLGSQFQHAKVGDLTKAISINDKFTFIKELFNNKGEEFSNAIQTLNQCGNMDAAFDCLEELKKKYYWDTTATAYLSLCDLLRRKFM